MARPRNSARTAKRRPGITHFVQTIEGAEVFLKCGRQYYYRFIKHIKPPHTPVSALRDSLFETVYWIIRNDIWPPQIREAVAEFEARLRVNSVGVQRAGTVERKNTLRRIMAEGARFISQFLLLERPAMREPQAFVNRKRLMIKHSSATVVRIPILEPSQAGFLELRTRRTNRKAIFVDFGLVLSGYAARCPNIYVIVFNRDSGLVYRTYLKPHAGIKKALTMLNEVNASISRGVFTMCDPRLTWCADCQYTELCAADVEQEAARIAAEGISVESS